MLTCTIGRLGDFGNATQTVKVFNYDTCIIIPLKCASYSLRWA